MRSVILALVVVAGCVGAFLIFRAPTRHRLGLAAYFSDAKGLRKGAQVRVAGLEVGRVITVTAHPEMREHPVEVKMALLTDYDLAIPDDSTVSLQTAGVLGETFAAIDVQRAAGPRIMDGGTLKSVEVSEPSITQVLQSLNDALDKCDSVDESLKQNPKQAAHPPPATKKP